MWLDFIVVLNFKSSAIFSGYSLTLPALPRPFHVIGEVMYLLFEWPLILFLFFYFMFSTTFKVMYNLFLIISPTKIFALVSWQVTLLISYSNKYCLAASEKKFDRKFTAFQDEMFMHRMKLKWYYNTDLLSSIEVITALRFRRKRRNKRIKVRSLRDYIIVREDLPRSRVAQERFVSVFAFRVK